MHTDIASQERKNRTNLSQSSQRNDIVTPRRSYKLLLQIAPCELALMRLRQKLKVKLNQHTDEFACWLSFVSRTEVDANEVLNVALTKAFGIHTFYEEGVEPTPSPHDFGNGRLYNLQLWQAIRPIYER